MNSPLSVNEVQNDMDNLVKNFYENNYNEASRIDRDPLEFIRSKEIISRYLIRPSMDIADIGGAAGVYSFWIAEMGHKVHLLDLTDKYIAQAKAMSTKTGIQLASYTCADARELPYQSNSFDIVLLMGPLYHLQDREDRTKCLAESFRVLKSGGVIISAYITRYASLIDGFKLSLIEDQAFREILECDVETGRHSNIDVVKPYFTTAYLHRPHEIAEEMKITGFTNVELIAVEGFANALNVDEIMQSESGKSLLLEYIRKTESVPELLGVSGHIIGVGVKP